jgi:hypothetical protein
VHAVHGHVLGRQADGADVRGEVDWPVETDDSHVVAIGLGGELEVGVNLDFSGAVGATWCQCYLISFLRHRRGGKVRWNICPCQDFPIQSYICE